MLFLLTIINEIPQNTGVSWVSHGRLMGVSWASHGRLMASGHHTARKPPVDAGSNATDRSKSIRMGAV